MRWEDCSDIKISIRFAGLPLRLLLSLLFYSPLRLPRDGLKQNQLSDMRIGYSTLRVSILLILLWMIGIALFRLRQQKNTHPAQSLLMVRNIRMSAYEPRETPLYRRWRHMVMIDTALRSSLISIAPAAVITGLIR